MIFQTIPFSAKKPAYTVSSFLHFSLSRRWRVKNNLDGLWWSLLLFNPRSLLAAPEREREGWAQLCWQRHLRGVCVCVCVCAYKTQCSSTPFGTAPKSEGTHQNMDITPQSCCLRIILKERAQKELRRNCGLFGDRLQMSFAVTKNAEEKSWSEPSAAESTKPPVFWLTCSTPFLSQPQRGKKREIFLWYQKSNEC